MTAIYQRARPITFAQVIGQEHVKTPLQAALSRGRIGHAYLFSGPRGVGKTTTARLVAMAVNCERDEKPCGECESCREGLEQYGNGPQGRTEVYNGPNKLGGTNTYGGCANF